MVKAIAIQYNKQNEELVGSALAIVICAASYPMMYGIRYTVEFIVNLF
jgi:hypothetical protein